MPPNSKILLVEDISAHALAAVGHSRALRLVGRVELVAHGGELRADSVGPAEEDADVRAGVLVAETAADALPIRPACKLVVLFIGRNRLEVDLARNVPGGGAAWVGVCGGRVEG